MKERKLTINITWANILSIIFFLIIALPTACLWYVLWGKVDIIPTTKQGLSDDEFSSWLIWYSVKWLVFMVVFFGGIVVHELIHGITWAHYAKSGWKSISFGVMRKMLTPYCHCNEPLKMHPYIIGALMPLIVLGIIPWVLGLSIGNIWITLFGVFYIVAASGDILIVWKLRNEKSTSTVLDHPTEAGCIVYDE